MFQRLKIAARAHLGALLLAAFAGCHHAPDEVRVREAIARAAVAARATDAGGVAASLSEDFDGNGGTLGRRDLANLVRLVRLRGEHIGVAMGPVTVTVRGDRLVTDFSVTLTSGGRLLPAQLGIYQVQAAWRRDGSDWVCYSAQWTRPL